MQLSEMTGGPSAPTPEALGACVLPESCVPASGVEQQSLCLPVSRGVGSEGGDTLEARGAGQPVSSVSGSGSGGEGATPIATVCLSQKGAAEAGRPVFCRSGSASGGEGETPTDAVSLCPVTLWMVVFKGLVNPHITSRLEEPSRVLCWRLPLSLRRC